MVRVEEGSSTFNTWIWNVFLTILVFTFVWSLAGFITMYKQEQRSFRRVHFVKLLIFSYFWMIFSFIFSIISLASFIFGGWKTVQNSAQYLSRTCAKLMSDVTFRKAVIRGKENLLSRDTPCVIIANHQSCADIALAYQIDMNFRWVTKWSAFCIPGVGGIMLLCGQVPLLRRTKRGNISSRGHMLKACNKLLKQGRSVWIFPQGTRDRYNLLDFKHGAFTLAIDANVPVIPISIDLPGDLWFNSQARTTLTVHPPIYPDDPVFKERDALMKKCFNIIVNSLSYGPEMLKVKEKREKEQQKLSSRQDLKKLK